jgi:hypothetical protein
MDERKIDYIDKLCDEITAHSYEKHKNEFSNQALGKILDVEKSEDFKKHVK